MKRVLEVNILDKGTEKVTVSNDMTFGELRSILNLKKNVRIYNDKNIEKKDDDVISSTKKVTFTQDSNNVLTDSSDILFLREIDESSIKTYEQQVEEINNLPYVKEYKKETKEVILKFCKKEQYYVKLTKPKVYLIKSNGQICERNPFLFTYSINAFSTKNSYQENLCNGNYVDCIKIIARFLKKENKSIFKRFFNFCKKGKV